MAQAVNLIDGLDGLAAGIVGHRRRGLPHLRRAPRRRRLDHQRRQHRRRSSPPGGGRLPRLPAVELPPGQDLHGRRRRAACSACSWRRPPSPSAAAPTPRCAGQTFFFFAPLFIPLVILGVPILDTAWSPSSAGPRGRAGARRSPTRTTCTTGSMRLGHGQRRAVLILWAWTALLSGAVLVPVYTGRATPGARSRVAAAGLSCSTRSSAPAGRAAAPRAHAAAPPPACPTAGAVADEAARRAAPRSARRRAPDAVVPSGRGAQVWRLGTLTREVANLPRRRSGVSDLLAADRVRRLRNSSQASAAPGGSWPHPHGVPRGRSRNEATDQQGFGDGLTRPSSWSSPPSAGLPRLRALDRWLGTRPLSRIGSRHLRRRRHRSSKLWLGYDREMAAGAGQAGPADRADRHAAPAAGA